MKTQLLAFLTFLLVSTGAYSQTWERLPSLNTFSFNDDGIKFTEHNGTAYVYGYIGLYKSTDNGLNWTNLNKDVSSPTDFYINDFTANSGGIYKLNESNKVFKSTDNGITWTLSMNGLPADASTDYIYSIGNKLFITGNGKMYVSNDNGANWSVGNTGNGYFSRANVIGTKLVYTKVDSIYSTTDGISISKYSLTGLPEDEYIESVCGTDQNMFALLDDGVYRSTNGNSWESIKSIQTDEYVQNMIYSNNKLYISIANESSLVRTIYSSDDNGNTWTNITTSGLPVGGAEIFPVTSGYFGSTITGISYLPQGSSTWTKRNNGIDFVSGVNLVVSGNALLYFSDYENGIQKSTDEGKTWTSSNNGLPTISGYYPLDEEGLFASGNKVYVQAYNLTTSELYRSIDQGSNWEKLTLPSGNYSSMYFMGGTGDTIIISIYSEDDNDDHYYRSINAGNNWTEITTNIPNESVYELAGNNNTLLSIQNSKFGHRRVIKSTDGGLNWTIASNGLDTTSSSHLEKLICGGGSDFYLFNYPYSYPPSSTTINLYRSEDNGATWQVATNAGLPSKYDVFDFVWNKDTLYITTEDGYMYKSSNKGESWTSIKGNLPGQVFGKMGFIGNTTFVGTWGTGIWRTPKGRTVSSVDNSIMENASFAVYPNPASESVTINYDLLDQKDVSVHILNSQGLVMKEFNNLNPSQRMSVLVNDLESGVYIVKLTFNDTSISKKLVIVK